MQRWRWLRAGATCVGLCALGVLAYRARIAAPGPASHGHLVAGFALTLVGVVGIASRFQAVIRALGVRVGLKESVSLQMQSMFYHFLAPGGVGSDAARIAKLTRLVPGLSARRAAVGVLLDRAVGVATMTGLAVATAPVGARALLPGQWAECGPLPLVVWTVAVAVLVIAAVWGACSYVARRQGAERLRIGGVVGAVAASVGMQLGLGTAAYCAAVGWGIHIEFASVLFAVASSLLFQLVPVNVAGAGGGEVAGYGIYVLLGLSGPGALLLVSTTYAYRLMVAAMGGLLELIRLNR